VKKFVWYTATNDVSASSRLAPALATTQMQGILRMGEYSVLNFYDEYHRNIVRGRVAYGFALSLLICGLRGILCMLCDRVVFFFDFVVDFRCKIDLHLEGEGDSDLHILVLSDRLL